MNKPAALLSALSTLAIVCFAALGTGCMVESTSESDSWDDADAAEAPVGTDEEALEAAPSTPSKGSLRACMCVCGNGNIYGPVGDGVDCQATCHNFFYNNNIPGCTNPDGGGYATTLK